MEQELVSGRCGACGKDVLLPNQKISVINTPTFSCVMLAHDTVRPCPACGTSLVPIIAGFAALVQGQLHPAVPVIEWKPLPEQEQSRVQLASSGMKIVKPS